MARRDDRAYREYVREEQRRQPGCPARELCDASRFQGTSLWTVLMIFIGSNPKLQAPNPNARPTPKSQTNRQPIGNWIGSWLGTWRMGVRWSLGCGAWDL